MGIFDKAKDALSEHSEHTDTAVDKLGDFVDGKTDGKYADRVDQGQDLAKDRVGDYLGANEPRPPA